MAIVACPALAWSGVARNRRARKAESARSAAERGQSDKPKEAEAGGGAPAEWETRALRALKSDLAPYVLPWLVVGAVLLFLLGDVTADIAVPMALFCLLCARLVGGRAAQESTEIRERPLKMPPAPDIPNPRLCTRQLWLLIFGTTGWSAFGRFVFAPWFVDVLDINTNPGLVWLWWMGLSSLLAFAWAFVGWVRERFAAAC